MVDFYHQKWDRPEILTLEPLSNVLKLAFEWVRHGGGRQNELGRGTGHQRLSHVRAADRQYGNHFLSAR